MELRARRIALYGRFTPRVRDWLVREIRARGGQAMRDLTRRCDILVIGARADSLIDSGALPGRLADARSWGKLVLSETAFSEAMRSPTAAETPLPLATALSQSDLDVETVDLLAAFDLVRIHRRHCRFADVGAMKAAATLLAEGSTPATAITAMLQSRATSPKGRHRLALDGRGQPALAWGDEMTALDGQRILPLADDGEDIDDVFEAGVLAEAMGDFETAARCFDMCSRADRSDAIAMFNLGNIRLKQQRPAEAAVLYQRALARDPDLTEARYNLARTLEAAGRTSEAVEAYTALLHTDRRHADALFNLGMLHLNQERHRPALHYLDRYLATHPPAEWAANAQRAANYCQRWLAAAEEAASESDKEIAAS